MEFVKGKNWYGMVCTECTRRQNTSVLLFIRSCYDNPQHENIYEPSRAEEKRPLITEPVGH